jgi:hypothetical protein
MYKAQGAAVAFIPPAGAGALRASFVSPLQPQAFGLWLRCATNSGLTGLLMPAAPASRTPAAVATLHLPSSCQHRLRDKSPRTPGAGDHSATYAWTTGMR